MSEVEIIQVEYQAIKKFCRGDKELALKITSELGATMRNYIHLRRPNKVTVDEMCSMIEFAINSWKN